MSNAHKGSRLILKDQLIPVDFSSAHFDYNVDATGLQYGNLLEPISGSVYTMRPFEGKFGVGIAVEEGTINLISNPLMNSNVNGWSVGSRSTLTWGSSYNPIKDGGGYMDIVGDTSGNTGFVQFSPITGLTNGGTYTISAYVDCVSGYPPDKVTIAGTVFYTDGAYDDYTWSPNSHTYKKIGYGNAYYVTRTFTLNSSKALRDYQPRIGIQGGIINQNIKVYAIQLENKSFATSIVSGTREYGKLQYDNITITGDFSISLHYMSLAYDGYASDRDIIALSNGVNSLNFFNGYGNDWYMGDETARTRFALTNKSVPFGFFEHLVIVREGTIVKLYRNGVLTDSKDFGSAPNFSKLMVCGGFGLQANRPNGIVSDLKIDNKPATAEEVQAWFISGKPFYNPYDYRAFSY